MDGSYDETNLGMGALAGNHLYEHQEAAPDKEVIPTESCDLDRDNEDQQHLDDQYFLNPHPTSQVYPSQL